MLELSNGEKLKCEFEYLRYYGHHNHGELYSCCVRSLNNLNNNSSIDGYLGVHKPNKNDTDVRGISIWDTNAKHIPANLGSLFHLIAFVMVGTQLFEIKTKDFHGMQNLERINLNNNKLTSVPLDAFATLTKLRFIDLEYNQIEELPNGIFKNNLELIEIYLFQNKIKYLGTEIFNDLKKLNYVDLGDNICINKKYDGATEIIQLKNDIKMN